MLARLLYVFRRLIPWLGPLLILAYWYSIHPLGFARGYSEDLGWSEITRQLIHDELVENGRPTFTTDQWMAPFGISLPYMSWSIERDWLGAYAWGWDKDFPFLWAYFGFSLVISYLGVGLILRRMRLSREAAWGVALVVVLLHIPRHFKTWRHYEHLLQHWVYLGLFLDAWFWQRFWRERTWDWRLEVWRGVACLGMLGTAGYFWGPLILEWLLVRGSLLGVALARGRRGEKTGIEPWPSSLRGVFTSLVLPGLISLLLVALDLRWYPPLLAEAKKAGPVIQDLAWTAHLGFLVQPAWLVPLWEELHGWFPALPAIRPINYYETLVTIGWLYWTPFLVALLALRKSRSGPGLQLLLPFLLLLVIGIAYACLKPFFFHSLIQAVVPFMSFFRVASRWGLFLPQMVAVCVALAWPELSAWCRERFTGAARAKFLVGVGVFVVSSGCEAAWLLRPTTMMPPMSPEVAGLLERIGKLPGTTVLDLPFCVTGGNHVCADQECPNYPDSTTGLSLRQWHGKKVYGMYQARASLADCEIYDRPPYTSWFEAWARQRCFNEGEWQDFCAYLDKHPETSAILLYSDVWTAAGTPACLKAFENHLGAPLGDGRLFTQFSPGAQGPLRSTRLIAFPGRCVGNQGFSDSGPGRGKGARSDRPSSPSH